MCYFTSSTFTFDRNLALLECPFLVFQPLLIMQKHLNLASLSPLHTEFSPKEYFLTQEQTLQ